MQKPASISNRLRLAVWLACLVASATVHAANAMPGMRQASRPELGSSAAFSPAGVLHAVGKDGEHVVLYRSGDEGATWSAPVVVNSRPEAISADGENRPKIAFAADGTVLVSWTQPLAKPFSGAIRFARSDDGERFAEPLTVHRDRAEITHRFESMVVAGDGRIVMAWIDKRELEAAKAGKQPYRGAAIYSAVSTDGGRSFLPEQKLADHSCECCRIAATVDADGSPLFMWRHVFAPNERDHALARLGADGKPQGVLRATFDRWKIDGCPHHGPSLTVDGDGVRHAVWFNQKAGEGRVFYGRLGRHGDAAEVEGQRPVGGARAQHADLVAVGKRVAIVWREFDGQRTLLRAEVSDDAGRTFRSLDLASSAGANDQPRALFRGADLFAFWRTEAEGMRLFAIK